MKLLYSETFPAPFPAVNGDTFNIFNIRFTMQCAAVFTGFRVYADGRDGYMVVDDELRSHWDQLPIYPVSMWEDDEVVSLDSILLGVGERPIIVLMYGLWDHPRCPPEWEAARNPY